MLSAIFKIILAAVIVFWVVRIFLKKDVLNMQLLMALGMLMSAMTLFVWKDTALFIFPFFFLSIYGMTSIEGLPKWCWLVLLPSILFIPFRDTMVFSVFLVVQVICMSVWSVIRINRFDDLLSEYYDNASDMSEDLRQTTIYLVATALVIIVMIILPDGIISVPWVAAVFYLFIAVLQFLLGSTVFHIEDTSMAAKEMDVQEAVQEPQKPTGGYVNDKMLQKVISEKMFLNPQLSLVSLAEELHTNRTYLSNSIHACFNQNFSDFINTLRIKYALELMEAGGDNVNIKDVAIMSGYNHLQSFYRNFEIIMNMTPKSWLTRQSQTRPIK